MLESPQQQWSNVRPEFAEQLRQPLCLALLRNCTSSYDDAYALATRLFTAIILQVRSIGLCPCQDHSVVQHLRLT